MTDDEEAKVRPTFKQTGFRFDRTITAGNLLTIFAGAIAGMSAYVDYKLNMDRLDGRVTSNERATAALLVRADEQAHNQAKTNEILVELKTILQVDHRLKQDRDQNQ
jgi:hypothetical protein